MGLEPEIDIDAYWSDLRSPQDPTLERVLTWVPTEQPLLDVNSLSGVLPALRQRGDSLVWTLGQHQALLQDVVGALLRKLPPRAWSFTNMPSDVGSYPKLYQYVMEVKFCLVEGLPSALEQARGVLETHLQENLREALVFYQWCHANEHVPRAILVFDAWNHASANEHADVTSILTYAGPAIGVLRGNS